MHNGMKMRSSKTIAKVTKLEAILKRFMTTADGRTNIFDELRRYARRVNRSVFHLAYPWELIKRMEDPWGTLGPMFDTIAWRFEPANFAAIWRSLHLHPERDPFVDIASGGGGGISALLAAAAAMGGAGGAAMLPGGGFRRRRRHQNTRNHRNKHRHRKARTQTRK